MIFDMFHTDPLFLSFFHVSYRPPFSSTGFFFTSFIQAPFFHLHVFFGLFVFFFFHISYRPPFFIHIFYMFPTGPFFHLHAFYMFHTGLLFFIYIFFYMFHTGPHFSFTCFLHVSYTFFTGLSKAIYSFFLQRKILLKCWFLHVLQIMIVEKDNVNQYLQNIYMLYQKL